MYLMIFLFFTNIFHRLAHLQKNNKLPYIISLLMNYWPFLNSKRHEKHHEYPQIKSYCITSGLLNPSLGLYWVSSKHSKNSKISIFI